MCVFSAHVSYVANTSIFARSSSGGKQFLVYSMRYQADSELAMILPLPTPPSPPEDALRFIDLSGYPHFFEDMDKGFIKPLCRSSAAAAALAGKPTLKVHEVGSFQASFVPHLRDFARLDSRFRLPDQAWEQMPQYGDYAFAVFKLRAGEKKVHPMAFEFPRRNRRNLFFPTVHVHDGFVEAKAYFDHSLYFQTPRSSVDVPFSTTVDFSPEPAGQFMDIARTQGVVDADTVIQNKRLKGMRVNRDIVVREEM
ncbi:MAG TPA: hypothetical protein VEY11_01465 [Pyrinomonadaceae bacterium]|nr:hypothetical protein [Pyrinomonadaceae bacterium]